MIHRQSVRRRPCYGRPMLRSRFALLIALFVLGAPLTSACDSQVVVTTGFRLSTMFPAGTDWFWRYNNDGYAQEVWWQGLGETSPDGEAWTTLRWWMNANSAIIADFAGDESNWNLDLYFAERPAGWYLMGYAANPLGPSAELGTEYLEGEGIPFLMDNVRAGSTWLASAGGLEWTTTASRITEALSFNSQQIDDSWRIDVSSDGGDWPFEGSWWLAQGPGVVQFDVAHWQPQGGELWQHLHNDSWQNRLGISN